MYVCIHANMLIFCRTLRNYRFTPHSCGNGGGLPWPPPCGIHAAGNWRMLGLLPALPVALR
jgi:hypothetical protein